VKAKIGQIADKKKPALRGQNPCY